MMGIDSVVESSVLVRVTVGVGVELVELEKLGEDGPQASEARTGVTKPTEMVPA